MCKVTFLGRAVGYCFADISNPLSWNELGRRFARLRSQILCGEQHCSFQTISRDIPCTSPNIGNLSIVMLHGNIRMGIVTQVFFP